MISQQIRSQQQHPHFSGNSTSQIDETAKQRYLEEEREKLRQFEEQRRQQLQSQTISCMPMIFLYTKSYFWLLSYF